MTKKRGDYLKKIFAVAAMLLMVLCSLQLAVTAQPTSQSRDGWSGWHNQVGPQPSFAWRQIDEGQRTINSTTKIKWETYKFRYNNNRVWINSSTYNKTNKRNNNENWNNRNNWYWNNWNNWNNRDNWNNNRNNNNKWNLTSYTITQLDKLNWRTLRITRNTYNATGGQIGTTSTRYVNTRYDAVRYYWRNRYWLVTPPL